MSLHMPELDHERRQRTFANGLIVSATRGGQYLGGDTWRSAFFLQRYLEAHERLVVGKRVCELGAGKAPEPRTHMYSLPLTRPSICFSPLALLCACRVRQARVT